jgi:RNase P/RNase MRP subunit POP5
MKLKSKASERLRRRYLLLENAGKEEIEKVILDYIGILGWAEAAPEFVNAGGKNIVLAVNRKAIDKIRAAFEIAEKKIKVKKVSGTIRGLAK